MRARVMYKVVSGDESLLESTATYTFRQEIPFTNGLIYLPISEVNGILDAKRVATEAMWLDVKSTDYGDRTSSLIQVQSHPEYGGPTSSPPWHMK